jgi:predicted ribosome quality control (RQC) complex YloA/Tae2 family protein
LPKEFSSFDVAVVARELRATMLNSRVNNIYQLDRKTLLLKLHKTDTSPEALILEAGRRLYSTSYALEKPPSPPAFCMGLRKYLRNARLMGLEQHEFERVVTLDFMTRTGRLQLVLEVFGDGNVILVNQDGRILQALSYRRMRDRSILAHEVFRFAPGGGRSPVKITVEELGQELKASADLEVVRVLARRLGIGGIYSEETLLRAGVDKNKRCGMLTEAEVGAIFDVLQSLLTQASTGTVEPFIVLDAEESFLDAVPFRLRFYESKGFKLRPYGTFDEALDEFYASVASVERAVASVKGDQIRREAERLKRIVADQREAVAVAETQVAENKSIGDVIYAHSAELGRLLDELASSRQRRKPSSAVVSETLGEGKASVTHGILVESTDDKASLVRMRVNGLRFGLNLRLSVFRNAAEFYERSKRAKQKLGGAEAALGETQEKLSQVEDRLSEAEALEHTRPTAALEELPRRRVKRRVKRREWFEKFHWFTSSDGFLVVAGKDAVSNEVLVKKYCAPEDAVFHADVAGAPFVVVKTEGRSPSEGAVDEAAEFAAAHSRGWREGFASVDVFWVRPEQLGKSGPSGQYVTRGSFVVTGKRSWRRNVPLRAAVGVLAGKDGVDAFVGGPPSSVSTKTRVYVVIVPGGLAGKRLFDQVLKALAEKMPEDQRQRVSEASVEEIRELIPYGVGEISRSRA